MASTTPPTPTTPSEFYALAKSIVDSYSTHPYGAPRLLSDLAQTPLPPHPPSDQALLLLSRALCLYTQSTPLKGVNDPQRRLALTDCLSLTTQAVSLSPACADAFTWRGVFLSEAAEYEGSKRQIELAWEMRELWERALTLAKGEVGETTMPNYCMGVWHCQLAALSWLEKKAAAVLFATPPEGSWEQGLAFLEKASATGGPFWYVDLDLNMGLALYNLGRKAEAKVAFERVMAYRAPQQGFEADIKAAQAKAKKYL
jgi:hypothetical protein